MQKQSSKGSTSRRQREGNKLILSTIGSKNRSKSFNKKNSESLQNDHDSPSLVSFPSFHQDNVRILKDFDCEKQKTCKNGLNNHQSTFWKRPSWKKKRDKEVNSARHSLKLTNYQAYDTFTETKSIFSSHINIEPTENLLKQPLDRRSSMNDSNGTFINEMIENTPENYARSIEFGHHNGQDNSQLFKTSSSALVLRQKEVPLLPIAMHLNNLNTDDTGSSPYRSSFDTDDAEDPFQKLINPESIHMHKSSDNLEISFQPEKEINTIDPDLKQIHNLIGGSNGGAFKNLVKKNLTGYQKQKLTKTYSDFTKNRSRKISGEMPVISNSFSKLSIIQRIDNQNPPEVPPRYRLKPICPTKSIGVTSQNFRKPAKAGCNLKFDNDDTQQFIKPALVRKDTPLHRSSPRSKSRYSASVRKSSTPLKNGEQRERLAIVSTSGNSIEATRINNMNNRISSLRIMRAKSDTLESVQKPRQGGTGMMKWKGTEKHRGVEHNEGAIKVHAFC